MRIPPMSKRKPSAPKRKLSVESVLDTLQDSNIGDIVIGIGAGINAMNQARKQRLRGEPIDIEVEKEPRG